jgi:DNA-binding MarR family transcriptional regulator
LGVTYPQYLVLATLWEYGDLTVGDLIQYLQSDYGTMTPLLKRMELRGLVKRDRSPLDERTVVVTLDAEGEALRERSAHIYPAICDTFDFTPERARDALEVLRGIVHRAAPSTDQP